MPRSSLRPAALAIAGLASLSLVACGLQLQEAEQTLPQGTAFEKALYDGYIELARAEYENGDYRASDAFARRALRSAKGESVLPESLSLRELEKGEASNQLAQTRLRLIAAFESGASQRTPKKAARAQTLFDCWMEEQEENRQPEDIAACRDALQSLVAELESDSTRLAEDKAREAEEKAREEARLAAASGELFEGQDLPAPMKTEGPTALGTYIVFFELNRTRLTEETKGILQEVVRLAKDAPAMKIRATGHADSVGNPKINRKLAKKRAETVTRYLIDAGVEAERVVVDSHGDADPLIPTGDDVPEVQNRRVEIRFEPIPEADKVPVASLQVR